LRVRLDVPEIVGSYAFINVWNAGCARCGPGRVRGEQGWKRAYNLSSTEVLLRKNIGDAFAARYKQLGGKIVGTGYYKFADTDFRALATQIVAKKPQVVTSTIVPPAPRHSSSSSAQPLHGRSWAPIPSTPARCLGPEAPSTTYGSQPTLARQPRELPPSSRRSRNALGRHLTGDRRDWRATPAIDQSGATQGGKRRPRSRFAMRSRSLKNIQGTSGVISYAGSPEKGVLKKDVFIIRYVNGKQVSVALLSGQGQLDQVADKEGG
jgi:hypothetical protein